MEIDLDALPDDADALRAIIVAQHQALTGMQASNRACEALIQALKITIARLKKRRFGASSEQIEREIRQPEPSLEDLEGARAAADAMPEPEDDGAEEDAPAASAERAPQRRRGKPRIAPDAPREIITLDPGERCPDCGGVLRPVGEIFARLGAVRRRAERPLDGSLIRRTPRSTLIDWCGQAAGALRPMADLIRDVVVASDRIHAEGSHRVAMRSRPMANPVAVLDPRK